MYTAGIDAGTQSIKIVVYNSRTKKIEATASRPLSLITEDGGVREQEAFWWIDALREAFSEIPADIKAKIEALAVSGQQHGFVPVAEDGTVLSPVKLWCDTSTAAECKEIENALGGRDAIAGKLGNPILP